jgi:ribulose-5-phosphate 4-epimerase/fuculose-1-phosphate aldolase
LQRFRGRFGAGLAIRQAGHGAVWITVGGLNPDDVVFVQSDSTAQPPASASSELPLHLEIHARRRSVRAVVHTHSPWATAWSHLGLDLGGTTEELAYHGLDRIPCCTP